MYIVVGASGFLGPYIIRKISEYTNETIIGTYTHNKPIFEVPSLKWMKVDLRVKEDLEMLNQQADDNSKVIYLSACSKPDFCEKNQEEAWDVNVVALANFVNVFSKASCLYFASTDAVFSNSKEGEKYFETSKTSPLNEYGRQKSLAEQIVFAKNYNVFRLPLLMGKSLLKEKKHFYDVIYETLSQGKSIEMFTDSVRSTLSFNQAADFLVRIIEKYGACNEKIVNFASDIPIGKYDYAVKYAEVYGFDKNLIIPVCLAEIKSSFTETKRAAATIMDNTKLKNLLNLEKIDTEITREII